MTPVQSGVDPAALPHVAVFGNTPASTPETVSFIMREQNLSQLESSVEAGFHPFLSVSQFAATYGQSRQSVSALTSYLAGFGIATQVYADDVDVVANGTAGEFDNALAVQQHQYYVPSTGDVGAQSFHGTGQSPELPSSIAQNVLAVLGLTNYSPFTSGLSHVDRALTRPASSTSNACMALTGLAGDCNTPSSFASDYDLSGLYHHGAAGQGETLAIVTLAALDVGAPQYYWQNIMHLPASGRTVAVDNVDGGPGAPSDASGTGETDLDVEQSGGLAPDANVIVYQAPNDDSGFADAFFSAASQNIASSVSASWGESETYLAAAVASGVETPAYEAAFDEAFLEFAAQGQSGFLAAGDAGAYDASDDIGTTNLAVDTSANSPYITSGGGTTLPWSGTLTGSTGIAATVSVRQQRAWGWDYLWPSIATIQSESEATAAETDIGGGGGGGGYSTIEPEPSYQQGVSGTGGYSAVQWLTPTDPQEVSGIVAPTEWSFNPRAPLTSGYGSGREEPDLSTNADPYSGYLLYEPSWAGVSQPTLQGGWGGTSFVAPQLNGSTAVIDSYLGRRVGFWNPSIYAFAQSGNSPFTPLDQRGIGNDNLYYTGTPGTLYNPATGLGYPDLSQLAADFAGQN